MTQPGLQPAFHHDRRPACSQVWTIQPILPSALPSPTSAQITGPDSQPEDGPALTSRFSWRGHGCSPPGCQDPHTLDTCGQGGLAPPYPLGHPLPSPCEPEADVCSGDVSGTVTDVTLSRHPRDLALKQGVPSHLQLPSQPESEAQRGRRWQTPGSQLAVVSAERCHQPATKLPVVLRCPDPSTSEGSRPKSPLAHLQGGLGCLLMEPWGLGT